MSEYYEPVYEPHPCAELPKDRETSVMRYMNLTKFADMLQLRALYFAPLDRFSDKLEGKFSQRQSRDQDQWLEEKGLNHIAEEEKRGQIRNRSRTYVNCWTICQHDQSLMWAAYAHEAGSVAIQSRVKLLHQFCRFAVYYRPLDVSIVKYIDKGEDGDYIDSFGGLISPIHKDLHHQLENEIRLFYWPNCESNGDGVWIPFEPAKLIERVILAPGSSAADSCRIQNILKDTGTEPITVEFSRRDMPVAN